MHCYCGALTTSVAELSSAFGPPKNRKQECSEDQLLVVMTQWRTQEFNGEVVGAGLKRQKRRLVFYTVEQKSCTLLFLQ